MFRLVFRCLIILCAVGSIVGCGGGTDKGKLVFADAGHVFWTAPTIVARIDSLYQQYNIQVDFFDVQTGLAAKNAVLAGSADIGLVATTPIAAGAFQEEENRLIATYVSSRSLLRIAKIGLESDPDTLTIDEIRADLKAGRDKIGYVPGTISEMLMENILDACSVPRDSVAPVSIRPPNMTNALVGGEVDYVVIWEPFVLLTEYAEGMPGTGRKARYLESGQYYEVALHLVTRPDVLEKKSEALAAFVSAVNKACDNIRSDPDAYRGRVEAAVEHPMGSLAKIWPRINFEIRSADRPQEWKTWLVGEIEKEAEWVAPKIKKQMSDASDFSAFVTESVLRDI